jgi:hypothetical protein
MIQNFDGEAPDRAAQLEKLADDFAAREGADKLKAILRATANCDRVADVRPEAVAPVMVAILAEDQSIARAANADRAKARRWSDLASRAWGKFTASANADKRGRANEHDG